MNSLLDNSISYAKSSLYGLRTITSLRLSTFRKVFSLLGKREKLAFVVLLAIALLNLFFSLRNFYFNHTILAPTFGGIYEEGLVGQPVYINPLLAYTDTDIALNKLVYSGLYKLNENGQITPDLADGMPLVSEDQKQYTINLKRNVKWHNDKSFTANDVVFTIQTLQDPAFKSPLRNLWLSTKVEKLSDYQVRFTTRDISGPFLQNLTLGILPQSVWGKVDSSLFLTYQSNLQAIGSGPYAIREIRKEKSGKVQQIALDSFSNFYEGKPKIDRIVIKFYDTNEDMLNALHSKDIFALGYMGSASSLYVAESKDIRVITSPLPQYQVLFFNVTNKTLPDQTVRQALGWAINRNEIVENILKNNGLLPYSPFSFGENKQVADNLSYDLSKATAGLDAAGWKLDEKTNTRTKNGKPLQLNVATNDSAMNSKTAESITESWRGLGLKINLTVLPTKQLTDSVIRSRNFDVLIFPLKLGADPDPFVFFHSSQVRDPGVNLTGFADQTADKLMTEARSTTNQQVRQQKYEQLNQYISEKLPIIFLSQAEYFYAVDKNVKNISYRVLSDPSDRFYNVTDWYMQQHRVWK